MKSLQPGARNFQLGREQTVKPYAGWKWDYQFDCQTRPMCSFALDFFRDFKFSKLVHTLRLVPESIQVEGFRPDPVRIVGLQRVKDCRVDVANIAALDDWPVPCPFTGQAFVDKPSIKLATVGVEPDLAAGLEGSQASASTACNPRLGSCLWNNGPSDLKRIAHTVVVFRSEVHQDGA